MVPCNYCRSTLCGIVIPMRAWKHFTCNTNDNHNTSCDYNTNDENRQSTPRVCTVNMYTRTPLWDMRENPCILRELATLIHTTATLRKIVFSAKATLYAGLHVRVFLLLSRGE